MKKLLLSLALAFNACVATPAMAAQRIIGADVIEGQNTAKNYIPENASHFEKNVGRWTSFADAAAATPVDLIGGAATVTCTRTATTPLAGDGSFLITKDAANRQGEGCAKDFSIDVKDKFHVMRGQFVYTVNSGTYASNDVHVWIYDVTNSALIQPVSSRIQNHVASAQVFQFEWQASSSTSYRMGFYVASTSASAYALKLDDIKISSSLDVAKSYGSAITQAVAATPVWVNADNITNTGTSSLYWHREGGEMVVDFEATYGGGGTASAVTQLTIPLGLSIDTGRLGASASTTVGAAQVFAIGSSIRYPSVVSYNSATTVFFSVPVAVGASGYLDSSTIASGSTIGGSFRVPIVGWQAQSVMSSDANTAVVVASYTRTGGAQSIANSTNTIIQYDTKVKDDAGLYDPNTGLFTAPKAGNYRFSGGIEFAASATGHREFWIEKIATAEAPRLFYQAGNATILSIGSGSAQIYLDAGQTAAFKVFQDSGGALNTSSNGGSFNWFQVEMINGPSQIAATESIEAVYKGNAGQALSGTAINVVFTTKVRDTHNMYNPSTGVITLPALGTYAIAVSTYTPAVANSGGQHLGVYINTGSTAGAGTPQDYTYMIPAASGDGVPVFKNFALVHGNAGDTFTVQADSDIGASRSLSTSADIMNIKIFRVGSF